MQFISSVPPMVVLIMTLGLNGINCQSNCICVPVDACNEPDKHVGLGKGQSCEDKSHYCCVPEYATVPPSTVNLSCGTPINNRQLGSGNLPWMIAVMYEERSDTNPKLTNIYRCGGTLISSQAVLTAAHCVSKKKRIYKIRIYKSNNDDNLYSKEDILVEKVIPHPEYHAGTLRYDVAVLILQRPVQTNNKLNIVCLPPQNMTFDTSNCMANVWDNTTFNNQQVVLREIQLPVVPQQICQEKLRETRLGKDYELHDSFICAGGEPGRDTCKGDGGSPLLCPVPQDQGRYYQVGIVAWGVGCGGRIPGVYANVARIRQWIDSQMTDNNLTIQY